MSKQDRQGVRTAADLEQKYNFGKSFAEMYGLAKDAEIAARDAEIAAEEAKKALDGLDHEEIFNRLTNYGKEEGIYRGADGHIYINATYIKSGKIAAEFIDVDNLAVDINGKISFDGLSNVPTYLGTTEISATTIKSPNIQGGQMNINNNFIVDAFGNLTVNGSINLSNGSITWGKNYPSVDGGGISESEARTIINDVLVSSPNISGGKFLDLSMGNWIEMGEIGTTTGYLNHYADNYSTTEPVCVMGYYNPNGNKSWVLAPFGDIILEKSSTRDKVFISGEWDFSYASVVGLDTLDSYGDVVLRAGDGNIAIRLDDSEDRINIYIGGTTWVIDADGFHAL